MKNWLAWGTRVRPLEAYAPKRGTPSKPSKGVRTQKIQGTI